MIDNENQGPLARLENMQSRHEAFLLILAASLLFAFVSVSYGVVIEPYKSFTPGDASATNTAAARGVCYNAMYGEDFCSPSGIPVSYQSPLQTEVLNIRVITNIANLSPGDIQLNLNYFLEEEGHSCYDNFAADPLNGDAFHAEICSDKTAVSTVPDATSYGDGLYTYDLSFGDLHAARFSSGAGIISVAFRSPTDPNAFFALAASTAKLEQGISWVDDNSYVGLADDPTVVPDPLPGVPAISPTFSAVPEPSLFVLGTTGLAAVLAYSMRRRIRNG